MTFQRNRRRTEFGEVFRNIVCLNFLDFPPLLPVWESWRANDDIVGIDVSVVALLAFPVSGHDVSLSYI